MTCKRKRVHVTRAALRGETGLPINSNTIRTPRGIESGGVRLQDDARKPDNSRTERLLSSHDVCGRAGDFNSESVVDQAKPLCHESEAHLCSFLSFRQSGSVTGRRRMNDRIRIVGTRRRFGNVSERISIRAGFSYKSELGGGRGVK